jgi:hypothetical protein
MLELRGTKAISKLHWNEMDRGQQRAAAKVVPWRAFTSSQLARRCRAGVKNGPEPAALPSWWLNCTDSTSSSW